MPGFQVSITPQVGTEMNQQQLKALRLQLLHEERRHQRTTWLVAFVVTAALLAVVATAVVQLWAVPAALALAAVQAARHLR